MPVSHGRFVWFELMTTDQTAAKAFYGAVTGWGSIDAPMPGMTYTMFTAGGTPIGGLMDLPQDARKAGAPPSWIGYVAVDDVDASAAKAKSLGGSVLVPPTDIPEVGRFAVIADPQGAALAMIRLSNPDQEPAPPRGTAGRVGWHELLAADHGEVFGFYAAVFGWTKSDAIDMGAMGVYQLFAAGGEVVGGMFTKPPVIPAPFWLYYVNVGDVDAAAALVTGSGGKILMGPMEVPGGDWVVQGTDPQGAAFALVGKRA